MNRTIRKVAVLGAGVMGSTIAAHMANAGLDTYLLDMVPAELSGQDMKKDLSPQSPALRNALAQSGLEKALKAQPPTFYVPEDAKLITIGNFEDHLSYLRDADWVIEAVIEDLETKKLLLQKIESFLRPGTIVSTNTSSLSVNKMSEVLGDQHRGNFLGTHFFNPPRYMKLVEIIPSKATEEGVIHLITDFCESRLGKGVVLAKDTPGFIVNRIGMHNIMAIINAMLDEGCTLEEIDAITGHPLGRPGSATFRTLDIVGLDIFHHICRNIVESLIDENEKKDFVLPQFMTRMVKEGLIGEKRGRGFYQKVKTAESSQTLSLDYNTLQYVAQRPAKLPLLDTLKSIEDPGARIKTLVYSDEPAGRFAWQITKKLLLYSAGKLPEVADNIISVDRAIKWGLNHEIGPFEVWDAIGVQESVERMIRDGELIPENILKMLAQNHGRFYQRRDGKTYYYDFRTEDYRAIEERNEIILLPSLRDNKKVVKSNASASLIDLGDGIACLEFHSPHNTIDLDIVEMINSSIDEVTANWDGLIIGNQGKNFCVGGNLWLVLAEAQNQKWNKLDFMMKKLQRTCQRIKFSEKPVVVAPFRHTLGAGYEICLAASRVRAAAETYMGLVEVGAGLVPSAGGCKEMLIRSIEHIPAIVPNLAAPMSVQPNLIPFVTRVFDTITTAKISASARDAQKIGYLSSQDKITLNQDYLLRDAKATVIALVKESYQPLRPRDDIRVTGRTGFGALEAMIYILKEGAFISEYDAHIAKKLATILTGGDLPQNTLVTEDYLLDLERENFLSLCGEAKTQARIQALLQTGRPLRN